MYDIFDTGTPKYSTANEIYERLKEISYNEEAGILGEMFADVSYENQDYYYTDKGCSLKEKFDALSDFGNNMWVMDLAISKLEANERDYPCLYDLHDLVFEAVVNQEFAKRTGFKQIFVEYLLRGDKKLYKKYLEEFETELRELDYFDFHVNFTSWQNVITRNNFYSWHNGYRNLCDKFSAKILNLQLEDEMVCIAECRSFLTSYDDFILGLKINQDLYNGLEKAFKMKVSQLKEGYENVVKYILETAESQGVHIDLGTDAKFIEVEFAPENKLLDFNKVYFTSEQIGEADKQ